MLFKKFDVDGSNFITRENLISAMSKFGKKVSDEELDHIMAEHDPSGEGHITMDEFKKMMIGFEDIVDDIQ